jgi:hypothetical protein
MRRSQARRPARPGPARNQSEDEESPMTIAAVREADVRSAS